MAEFPTFITRLSLSRALISLIEFEAKFTMFNKILVALDRSTASQTVFHHALFLAKAMPTQLMLLHVLSTEDYGNPGLEAVTATGYYQILQADQIKLYQQRWQADVNESWVKLQLIADQTNHTGITTEIKQLLAQPG